jgi:glycosyltransferase involved in cell wall biosynthesis
MDRRKVLVTAYAVNPYNGSEDATGWNIPFQLAEKNEVTVITRKNNRPEIERFYAENKNKEQLAKLRFEYFDLPPWLIFWKKKIGERGYVLYFYLWQLFIPFFIKRLKLKFDIVHALNFHSDSHPQFLWLLGKPVFWGPIGHHSTVPKQFIRRHYSRKSLIKDRVYNAVKFIMRTFSPFYYLSKWSAKKIFVINSKINDAVRAKKSKIIILPAVACDQMTAFMKPQDIFNIVSVGRFTFMKGFDLIIEAFALFVNDLPNEQKPKVKMTLIGKGEERNTLNSLIIKLKLENHIEIIEWVERKKMNQFYKKASIFAFGSHEGAGMVVTEALSYGLPIVCFDNEGPGELCTPSNAMKIKVKSYGESAKAFSEAYLKLFEDKNLRSTMSKCARKIANERYNWKYKSKVINKAYDSL